MTFTHAVTGNNECWGRASFAVGSSLTLPFTHSDL